MDKTDKPRFAELMAFMAQNFATILSATDLENYWCLLRKYPLVVIEQAMINYCRNPQGHAFMPRPGELIAAIEGHSTHQAIHAWDKVHKAIKHIGAYSTVIFDDRLIHVVIQDLGGWISLCHSTAKELPFRAREFEKRYISYLNQPPAQHPAQLSGITDQENSSSGFNNSTPLLIGSASKAYQVYKTGQPINMAIDYNPLDQTLMQRLAHIEPSPDQPVTQTKSDETIPTLTHTITQPEFNNE